MKTKYNWDTDEGDWDSPSVPPTPRPKRKRRAFIALVGLVIIAISLGLALFDRRLASREEIVRQNILAAHRTWEQAVLSGDSELFVSLLVRDDLKWFQSQRRLLISNLLLDRTQLGLSLIGPLTPAFEVLLDSNWRRAEVSFPLKYSYSSDGSEHDVTLLQTNLMQIRGNRWQIAIPGEPYWGDVRSEGFGRLFVTYPERDANLVRRLANDLSRAIDALCRENQTGRECAMDGQVPVVFDTDPESLLSMGNSTSPAIIGRAFILPSPSLVGIPVDEAAYEALYNGYTSRIIDALRNNLALPIPLPNQNIAALCSRSIEEGFTLFSYNPSTDSWTPQSEPRRFSSIQPLPDDSGLILRAGFPGVGVSHLELFLHRGGVETPLIKEGVTGSAARLNGILSNQDPGGLLISTVDGTTGGRSYQLLPLDSCEDGQCDLKPLEGYPIWSPQGHLSLILVQSELYLGDKEGVPTRRVGRAFSPFWVSDEVFGYIRLLGNETNESPEMELVLSSAIRTEEKTLVQSADFSRWVKPGYTGAFRMLYAASSPSDPNFIYVAGSPVASEGDKFYIVRLELQGDEADLLADTNVKTSEVVVALDDMPVGNPATLTPTGYLPFSITPDGRYLVTVRFADSVTGTWHISIHDVERKRTQIMNVNFPGYPYPFPFMDWSGDGNWLLLIDKGFLRLVAPAYDYDRVVTHEFDVCRYPAWINRPSVAHE